MTGKLTAAQYKFLTAAISPGRVQHLNGQSHVEQWDIRRHLIRAFGFGGFDIDTKALDLVREIEIPPANPNGKPRWTVVYRAELRLTIKSSDGSEIAHYEDGASGGAQNQPSIGDAHDQAMKTALSQALKRCAVNLGDQFGLSLYNGGSADPVVHRSLVAPVGALADAEIPRDEQVQAEPESASEVPGEPAAFPGVSAAPTLPAAAELSESNTPSELRAAIKTIGEAKRLTIREIAEDFFEWSQGDQIGQADSQVLFEYLQHLKGKAAA